jgi:general secretion pathway protein E
MTTDSTFGPPALGLPALAAARRESQAGAGTVLDALLRHWAGEREALLAQLEARTGVAAAEALADVEPAFELWPHDQAHARRCVVLRAADGTLEGAAADPWSDALHRDLERALRRDIPLRAATGAQLDAWLRRGPGATPAPARPTDDGPARAPEIGGPIVSFVDAAVQRAIAVGASDIHFECDRRGVTVKHRIDGVMQRFARMEGVASAEAVISRVKVLAQLDITERRLPQDGRYRHAWSDGAMDVRVSIMPSVHGEDAVLRLLDKSQFRGSAHDISLHALGFDAPRRGLIESLAMEPSGMLLVTGPTGSGKTTTLYAVLSAINTGLEKIVTIEDPVEYELEGVLQIPVNERKGLTFAKGLRSILRHDPDKILVGEIRDAETAQIAVQSALTGHLVFTTVHANTVFDVVGRFEQFGIDAYTFASAINGVLAQRLFRRLCARCAVPAAGRPEDGAYLAALQRHDGPARLMQARGCEHCRGTGYSGRFALGEQLLLTPVLKGLIAQRALHADLQAEAERNGWRSLRELAIAEALQGHTTMEEVDRVAA